MFGHEPIEGRLTHLNNCNWYYGDNKGKVILAELHKLWKYHAACLKDIHYRKDDSTPCKPKNNMCFEVGQAIIDKNHAHHNFEPRYLMD